MAKYYDIDNDVRINGKLTVNGDTSIPSSFNLLVGGNITGNIISGNSAIITNVTSTGTISGGTIKGNGATLTVNGTTANGGTVPISNGWAYTHENKIGSQGHIPTGGTATTFLRGDGTWVTPTDTDTNNYVSSVTSTDGGNGTLTLNRSGLTALTIDLSHNHNLLYLGINAKAVDSDKLDNLDSSQFLRSDQGGTLSGILNVSGSSSTPLVLQRNSNTNVNLQFVHTSANAFLGIDNTGQLKFGSVADLNSSGYTVWHSNNFTPANKLDSSVFATHTGNTGAGGHIPTGGSATTFLRGDNTWVTPTDTNTFVTGLSSTAGGNGTLTVTRNTGGNLTVDLSHTHSQYVTNNTTNQSVLTGFTMSGNAYVGTSSTAGALIVRTTSGANAIQLAGDNATQLAGTTVYMNASGNAKFSGTVTANNISVTSTTLVTNLNAEMVNGVKEKYITKNESIYEISGKGVYTGMNVVAQTVPNMTVLVNAGTAYTNSGMRVVYPNTNVSLATSSATYDRKDVVYMQGSSAGANEGVVTVATGTPASTPTEPSIPADAVKLAVVLVPQNIGSIQNIHITDTREWKPFTQANGNLNANGILSINNSVTSTNPTIAFSKPIKNSGTNTSLTFTTGTTSIVWTHNQNISNYTVRLSCNSFEPHVRWTNKTVNAVTIELDDVCESDVIVDVSIEAY
jgi:hypothetical protein